MDFLNHVFKFENSSEILVLFFLYALYFEISVRIRGHSIFKLNIILFNTVLFDTIQNYVQEAYAVRLEFMLQFLSTIQFLSTTGSVLEVVS